MLTTILLFIAVLAVLVLAHEFGHFIVAKKAGMAVEEFGFGFPPRLFGIRRGNTLYSINLIPLGGFVKIKGEGGGNYDHDSFQSKSAPWRLAVLVAGVTMNFVLAAVLLTAGYAIGLPSVIDQDTPADAVVRDAEVRIATVAAGSPAERGAVHAGDVLVSIDGMPFSDPEQARAYIGAHGDNSVMLVLGRDDGTFYNALVRSEDLTAAPGIHGVGVGLVKVGLLSYPIHLAALHGVLSTGDYTKEVVGAFAGIVRNLFVRNAPAADLSGPVGIAVLTRQAASMGFAYLLQFTAILSINLAVVNFLPLPALDGGRMLFLAIEKFRRRSSSARSVMLEAAVHRAGFLLLMGLVIFVTYHDIARLLK